MSGERSEFRRMAESIASTSGTPAMLPVIEKEVLHYHILSAMRESGYLDRVVFQGGTSLRLCHGSPRYSEDLDFVGGDAFTGSDMRGLGDILVRALSSVDPDIEVRVREPDDDGSMVSRWRIRIRVAGQRRALPSQVIKLEVAAVPSYEPVAGLVNVNYPQLSGLFDQIPVMVESLDEILADKMVSYVCSDHPRYRDLWDMNWLLAKGVDGNAVWDMANRKASDYNESAEWGELQDKAASIGTVMKSDEFSNEMRRFLEPRAYELTLGNNVWRKAAAQTVESFFHTPPAPADPANPMNLAMGEGSFPGMTR